MDSEIKQLRILIIEDNEEHAEIISRHLRRIENLQIETVMEAFLAKGLTQLATQKFDAILLDLRLPDSDIHETLPRVVQAASAVPIVVLSSLDDRETAIRAAHEGAGDYLYKSSMSSETLARTILSCIERKESELHIKRQLRQTALLSDLSQFALNEGNIADVKHRAQEIILGVLQVEYVRIIDDFDDSMKGLKIDVETLNASGLIEDLSRIGLAKLSAELSGAGMVSGLNMLLCEKQPFTIYGLILIYSSSPRSFKNEEIEFIKTVASVLSSAVIRTRLEAQLKLNIESLKLADRRKDDFLATLSHELRTPLNVITGYLEILKDPGTDTEDFKYALDIIDSNLKVETKIISETLDVARIITGKMKLDLSLFPLAELIETSIDSLSLAVAAKGLKVVSDISPDLGNFYGDQNRMRQLIWNLLSNAVKFTPLGGSIRVSARKVDSFFELRVQDSGIGIAPENIKFVFDRFWQEDASIARQHMGLGLGLGIVRHIAELHGGTVEVFSEGRDRGTRFILKVPASIQVLKGLAPSQEKKLEEQTQSRSSASSIQGVRILAIDDSEDSLVLLQRLLKKSGAEVQIFSKPEDGLRAAKESFFDVMICDIGMPIMNGYELIQALRHWEFEFKRSPLPAIALTAYVGKDDIQKAIESGFQLHLAKPYELPSLKRDIVSLLEVSAGMAAAAGPRR